MKKILVFLIMAFGFQMQGQTNTELLKHYEAYYKQMRLQGDVQGIINAMTHLNVISPSEARQDTLAYIYMSEGKYVQALNTIGVVKMSTDSDIAVEVKAVSLKAVKRPDLAIEHFVEMFKREESPLIAYELAELNMQTNKPEEIQKYIDFGLANATADMKKAFYETQPAYEVPLKSAFMYLNALSVYNKDKKGNIDAAIDILDATLKEAPNFNLVQLTKTEMLRQKEANLATESKN
jgi:tetratricopeptide (TPR) repeat protein